MSKKVVRGKEAQPIPQIIKDILDKNAEALIIVANPDRGESNIAVYTKLADDRGVLADTIVEILTNLMFTAKKNVKCTI